MHKFAKVVGRLLGLLIRNKIITVEEAFYIIEPLNEKIKKENNNEEIDRR